jgi:ElaB/YqjD/DUF883 family membrane-anchored ribosome-binding protein
MALKKLDDSWKARPRKLKLNFKNYAEHKGFNKRPRLPVSKSNHKQHLQETKNMKKHTSEATADLGALVEQGKEFAGNLREQAVAGAKAADKAVREHPYKAIGIAFGVGAVLGLLLARRSSKED